MYSPHRYREVEHRLARYEVGASDNGNIRHQPDRGMLVGFAVDEADANQRRGYRAAQ